MIQAQAVRQLPLVHTANDRSERSCRGERCSKQDSHSRHRKRTLVFRQEVALRFRLLPMRTGREQSYFEAFDFVTCDHHTDGPALSSRFCHSRTSSSTASVTRLTRSSEKSTEENLRRLRESCVRHIACIQQRPLQLFEHAIFAKQTFQLLVGPNVWVGRHRRSLMLSRGLPHWPSLVAGTKPRRRIKAAFAVLIQAKRRISGTFQRERKLLLR